MISCLHEIVGLSPKDLMPAAMDRDGFVVALPVVGLIVSSRLIMAFLRVENLNLLLDPLGLAFRHTFHVAWMQHQATWLSSQPFLVSSLGISRSFVGDNRPRVANAHEDFLRGFYLISEFIYL